MTMAKSDKKDVYNASMDKVKSSEGEYNALSDKVGGSGGWGGITNPLANKSSAYQNLNSAYANAYRPDYGEADTGFRRLASSTGGFDQDKLNQIYGNVDTLTGIGQTGGI